jgi:hypothetical protein
MGLSERESVSSCAITYETGSVTKGDCACGALALAHRAKAAESWAHKEYDKAGYELKAAAHGLESAAGWVGTEAKAGAAAAVADKLASGATWAREEVAKGFESLGHAINALGQKLGSRKKAAPVDVGS